MTAGGRDVVTKHGYVICFLQGPIKDGTTSMLFGTTSEEFGTTLKVFGTTSNSAAEPQPKLNCGLPKMLLRLRKLASRTGYIAKIAMIES